MELKCEESCVSIHHGKDFSDIIRNITNRRGSFSGIYEYNGIKLVASTDGVGTKLKLCEKFNYYDTIGIDLVAMCVNDIICRGAKPLFFLDYYVVSKLSIEIGADIIQGIQDGCQEAGCILLGGETVENPHLYKGKDFDLSGFCVGIIEGDVYPKKMAIDDKIYGIQSSGIHSDGFPLINQMLEKNEYDPTILMKPTRIYVNEIQQLKNKYKNKIKGFVHITGGLIDNIPRIINEGLSMEIINKWDIPEIFQWIYQNSDMDIEDMLKTYNCGIGMVVIFEKDTIIDDDFIELGRVIQSNEKKIDYTRFISSFDKTDYSP